tara:strand:- start:1227 stop:1610 length:384 start_codon:yes stop_codon:yes gene_type:complete
MRDDPEYVIKVEKAIAEKYGEETVQNPKSNWNEEKERDYLEQLKKLSKKERKRRESRDKVDNNGFFISKKLLNKESKRSCQVCGNYSFSLKDDLYMNKYECCFGCYIQWVEDREERWEAGWRPGGDK